MKKSVTSDILFLLFNAAFPAGRATLRLVQTMTDAVVLIVPPVGVESGEPRKKVVPSIALSPNPIKGRMALRATASGLGKGVGIEMGYWKQ